MITDDQVLSIEQVSQLDDYKLKLVFNDQSTQVVDLYSGPQNQDNRLRYTLS